jgi:hypothetical protein
MRLFSPSRPSQIVLPGELEFEELERENERLRELAITLTEKAEALRSRLNCCIGAQIAIQSLVEN